MRWYLPNSHPIFWHEMRRRILCAFNVRLFLKKMALCILGIAACLVLQVVVFYWRWDYESWNDVTNAGYYLIAGVLPILLIYSWFAVRQITEERDNGSLDDLLLFPISSQSLFLQKFAALILRSSMFLNVVFIFPFISIDNKWIILLNTGVISFIACGLMMGCLLKSTWSALIATYFTMVSISAFFVLQATSYWDANYKKYPYTSIGPIIYAQMNHRHASEAPLIWISEAFIVLTFVFLTIGILAIDRQRGGKAFGI